MKKLTLKARRAQVLRARKIWRNKFLAMREAKEQERTAWAVLQELRSHIS